MGSPLDFVSSEGFRKSLIIKNLAPYAKSPNRQSPPINYEYIQSNLSVIDSPDALIDEPTFANKLYPLNEWGSEGGYKDVTGVEIYYQENLTRVNMDLDNRMLK